MQMEMEVARPPGGGLFLLPHQIYQYHETRPATSLAPAATTLGRPVVRMRTAPHEFYDGSMVAPRGVPATSPAPTTAIAGGGPRVVRMPNAPHELFDGSMVLPRGVPASARAVAGLPRTTVGEEDGGETGCAVFLEGYAGGDALRTMPYAHAFYEGWCIMEWLSASPLCPLCRFRLPSQAEEDAAQRLLG